MRKGTVDVYKLTELKEVSPKGYERVHDRWREGCDGDSWTSETMDSLKAVVEACNGTLRDWSIGAYSHSSMNVRAEDYTDEDEEAPRTLKDAEWFLHNVLKPHGYVKDTGFGRLSADFPGHCAFTGYCADDSFLEAAYKAMCSGETLTEALEGLASVASKMFEDDLEQEQDEESMLANWGDNEYTIDGEDAP